MEVPIYDDVTVDCMQSCQQTEIGFEFDILS